MSGAAIELGVPRATGENVYIRKTKREDRTESGMLHLPDVAQQRNGEAVVLSVGPKCWRLLKDSKGEIRTVRAGDVIRYHPLGQVEYVDDDTSLIRESAVLLVIEVDE